MDNIDKKLSVPLYIQLAKLIESTISNGIYLPGSKIPTEQELMQKYDISRVTVRQTMKHLEDKGLVERKQGLGTFVNKKVYPQKFEDIAQFYPSLLKKGMISKMDMLEYEMISPNSLLQEKLKLSPQDEVLKFTRKYLINKNTIVLGQGFIPNHIANNWSKEEATQQNSLKLIQEKAGIILKNFEMKIKATVAKTYHAKVMKIKEGEPILQLTRLAYSIEEDAVEYVIISFPGDAYEIVTEVMVNEENRLLVDENIFR